MDALLREGTRLVTLVGPPGIGKTRLAAACFERARGEGAEVTWVDLATAVDGEGVCQHLAGALGLRLGWARASDLAAEIAWAIAGRKAPWIVFDEAERCVTPLAELLPRWLAASVDARAIVTSRERLRMPGEAVVEVGPLPVDDGGDVLASPAGRLLLQRAGIEEPGTHADALAALVRALEGVPLAIELVAARLSLMDAREVLDRLTRGAGVLDARPLRGRSTLREAIDASWSLLEAPERRALACCSLFCSTFTVAMAEEVVGEAGALGALEGLRDKSLIVRDSDARLRLYTVVRAFASERLVELGLAEAARERYVGACAELARQCERRWAEKNDPEALRELMAMADDLRAAFDRAHGPARAHLALGLAAVFGARGPQSRALEPLEAVAREPLEPALASRVALAHARALSVCGRVGEALEVLARAGEPLDAEWEARFAVAEAELELARGCLDASRDAAERALRAAPPGSAVAVDAMRASALASHAGGRLDEAYDAYERAHQAALEQGRLRQAARLRADLATVRLQQHRHAEARELFDAARAELDPDTDGIALGLAEGNTAILEQELGRFEEAEALFSAGIERLHRIGHRLFVAHLTGYAGALAHERERFAGAAERYRSALSALRAVGDARLTALVASLLGAAECARDRIEAAREAFAQADSALARVVDPGVVRAVEVHRGHLDLALGRAGELSLEEARARAAARLESGERELESSSDDVRLARRLLRAALGLGALAIDAAHRRLTLPDGAVVDLGTRAVLWRIVEALAARRRDAPGAPLSADELIAAGWPGERLTGSSGPNRLKVALSTLRKLGLRDVIRLGEGGYFLAPEVPLLEVERERSAAAAPAR